MKRVISISFLAIYLLTTLNVSFSLHFCKGFLSDVDLYSVESSCGDDENSCEMKTSSCCSSELVIIDIEDEHQTNVFDFDFNTNFILSFFYPEILIQEVSVPKSFCEKDFFTKNANSPPIYILNSALVLYA